MKILSVLTNLWNSNATLCLLILILIVVAVFVVYYLKKAKEHPKGLIAAALSNMGERFGYYIMNAVLLLFLVSKFGLPDGTAGLIYSFFYFGIYILALVGGLIADKTQNYNRTIQIGLFIMAAGYVALAIPLFSKVDGRIIDGNGGWWGILIFTCIALLCIAFGNGLFKGNLQALVGKLYDEFEEEAARKGPEALKIARDKRDSGFQIFYVFINIGGVIAPFIAPMLRKWWLGRSNFIYNADMTGLCHKFIGGETSIVETQKFIETANASVTDPAVWRPVPYAAPLLTETYDGTISFQLAGEERKITLVNMLTGDICEVPEEMTERKDGQAVKLVNLPITDVPYLLCFGDFLPPEAIAKQ